MQRVRGRWSWGRYRSLPMPVGGRRERVDLPCGPRTQPQEAAVLLLQADIRSFGASDSKATSSMRERSDGAPRLWDFWDWVQEHLMRARLGDR